MSNVEDIKVLTLSQMFLQLVDDGMLKTSSMHEKAVTLFAKSKFAEVPVAELCEETVREWVDGIVSRRSNDTLIRYVESLGKICSCAVKQGILELNPFTNLKSYIISKHESGCGKASRDYVEIIRILATGKIFDTQGFRLVKDIYLFAFYQGGLTVEEVVEQQSEETHALTPQAEAIRKKYAAPRRKYIFPLDQWKRTTHSIVASLENSLKAILKAYKVEVTDVNGSELVRKAWVSVSNSLSLQTEVAMLEGAERMDVLKRVANSIVDMSLHWYAIQFVGKEDVVQNAIEEIAGENYVRFFYPMDEICKRVGRKRVVEQRPTIRNIVFIETLTEAIAEIDQKRPYNSKYYVIKNTRKADGEYSIIPSEQMRRFSAVVSKGMNLLSSEDVKQAVIEVGNNVEIEDGPFEGITGQVVKIINKEGETTMLQIEAKSFGAEMEQILGKRLYLTLPEEGVRKLNRD